MISENVEIKVRTYGAAEFSPYLKCYVPELNGEVPPSFHKPAIIICPGGGYEFRSFREDEPIALEFAARGFAAFVLEYSVAPAVFPQALCELCEAIAHVRGNAEKYGVDPKKVFVCGFSAGGHLAASAVTMYDSEEVREFLGGTSEDHRPDGGILCYPVISKNVDTHQGSFNALLGERKENREMQQKVSLETHINKNTPSCFIWATSDDQGVPVHNSILFAQKLAENGVKFELEIFHSGYHGLALCNEYTSNGDLQYKEYHRWVDNAANWVKNNFR